MSQFIYVAMGNKSIKKRRISKVSFHSENLVSYVEVEILLDMTIQGSHRDWKTWKMKVVMEKSWNMKNWPKVIEFCDQSWNFTNFAPELC